MNRISLPRLRLALQYRLAVLASPLGGWMVKKDAASRPPVRRA